MKKSQALKHIHAVFAGYKRLHPPDKLWLRNLKSGKLYELFCLAKVIQKLRNDYGYRLAFKGASIRFQMSGGKIDPIDPHFEVQNRRGTIIFEIYTDIEFRTLGSSLTGAGGLSACHELDVVIVEAGTIGHPPHDKIALGVECKSHAVFIKPILKEVLGIRREMSFLVPPTRSKLSLTAPSRLYVDVPANPPSEYWLAFIASNGSLYSDSPKAFGIGFKNWQP